jgi:2-oxoisovalerate dehydrogenase E1 component beta subunit
MAGVTLTFRMRGQDRVGLVYVGDGATSTGAFTRASTSPPSSGCRWWWSSRTTATPTRRRSRSRLPRGSSSTRRFGYGIPGLQADGNDVLAVYDVTKMAVDHARAGGGVTLVELMTYRRKGHAEHDNQSYVPAGEIDRWAAENDPLDRYLVVMREELGATDAEIAAMDARVHGRDRCRDRRSREVSTTAATGCARRRLRESAGRASVVVPRRRRSRGRCERASRRVGNVAGGAPRERLMAEITYLEALREGIVEEMARDENVFCMGEDIGAYGGAFKVTDGLLDRFGESRVIDTPISEIAIVGAAAGAGHMGMRPVVEMQFIDFIANAYDMLTNYVATARYRAFLPCPMVVRGPSGGYVRGGPFHSQNPEAGFIHTPGLKVVYPATAEDAKGLMKAAIRDDDCVLFFEHKYLYRRIKAEMPAGDHVVPIGKARVAREGKDVSIITYAATVWKALEAAESLEKEDGLSVEVIDLRTLAPLDDDAYLRHRPEDESRADPPRGYPHRRHRG